MNANTATNGAHSDTTSISNDNNQANGTAKNINHKKESKMNFSELNKKIIQWAKDRGIFDKATPLSQWNKTNEEVIELRDAILLNRYNPSDRSHISDAIGDIIVTLIIQAEMHGLDTETCLNQAYNEIKDRKGKMIDGVFVKDE
jgi:NTP pyrophosphatase (non-canonical NTP hydrolase)